MALPASYSEKDYPLDLFRRKRSYPDLEKQKTLKSELSVGFNLKSIERNNCTQFSFSNSMRVIQGSFIVFVRSKLRGWYKSDKPVFLAIQIHLNWLYHNANRLRLPLAQPCDF